MSVDRWVVDKSAQEHWKDIEEIPDIVIKVSKYWKVQNGVFQTEGPQGIW